MNQTSMLIELSEIASGQWGLFTSAQANQRGISRLQLARLADASLLERIRHGVYKIIGAPASPYELLRAEWLSFKPDQLAWVRSKNPENDVVVTASTAAWLAGESDFYPQTIIFASSFRLQKMTENVRIVRRHYKHDDLTLQNGLPSTNATVTFLELLKSREDFQTSISFAKSAPKGSIDLSKIESLSSDLAASYGMKRAEFINRITQSLLSIEDELAQTKRLLSQLQSQKAAA